MGTPTDSLDTDGTCFSFGQIKKEMVNSNPENSSQFTREVVKIKK